MFQTFDVTARPDQGPPRLDALRAVLARAGLDGFIVPRADAHQGEYVAARDERLAWLTGFTGSAGFCVVLAGEAGVFIDGRYRTQVKAQVDLGHFTPVPWPETSIAGWLRDRLETGARVGFDPWLMSHAQVMQGRKELADVGVELVAVDQNPVDMIWEDQPGPPMAPAKAHPMEFAGESHADKRARLAEDLRKRGLAAAAITLPDSIAWLLNIRGADVPRNPIMQGFAILHDDASVTLFAEAEKLTGLEDHLGDAVSVTAPQGFAGAVAGIEGRVLLDTDTAPYALWEACAEPVMDRDPCVLPKARKNATEISGMAEAHRGRDDRASGLARCPAAGNADRKRCRQAAGIREAQGQRAAGHFLRHDLGHRAERRHHALPGDRGDRCAA